MGQDTEATKQMNSLKTVRWLRAWRAGEFH